MRFTSWTSTAALVVILASGACGSSSAEESGSYRTVGGGPGDNGVESEKDARRAEVIRRHAARQDAACEQVARVLTRCAIQDARETMSPEEFAKLKVEELAPKHRAEFTDRCSSSDMSVRQIEVFEQCVATESACPAFLDCLDQAKPQP